MSWLFILALAAGVPLAVPPTVRALWVKPSVGTEIRPSSDGEPITASPADPARRARVSWSNSTFAGFALVIGALVGMTFLGFDASATTILIASIALGGAAGAVHPEFLHSIARTRFEPGTEPAE